MTKFTPPNGILPEVWASMDSKARRKISQRNYDQKRKEKKAQRQKEYFNRPEVKERRKKYFKEYRDRPNANPNSLGSRHAGAQTLEQYCYRLMHSMRRHLKLLKMTEIEYTKENLIELAKRCDKFIVDEKRAFVLRWSNGFFNSASIQRWNNSRGYSFENTTPIPTMLQCPFAFTMQQLREIPFMIQQPTPKEFVDEWALSLKQPSWLSLFLERGHTMKKSTKEFGFKSVKEAVCFLRDKFIEQGGLCFYSGLPMRLMANTGAFVMSVERVNPIFGYTPENIALICVGLNGPIFGQHSSYRKNDNASEAHQRVVDLAKFNLEYWCESMCYTQDDLAKIEETRARNRELMRGWLEPQTQPQPQPKRARVEWDLDDDDDWFD